MPMSRMESAASTVPRPFGAGRSSGWPLVAIALAVLLLPGLPLRGGQDTSISASETELKAAEPHFIRGLKEFGRGRHEAAALAFERCLREMPRHAYARYYLANLHYIRGDYQTALVHMEQALDGLAAMQELDEHADESKDRAIRSYQQLLKNEWENAGSCRAAREIESLAGELTDAQSKLGLQAKKEQGQKDRQKAHFLYFSGNVLFQLKRFPDASRRYQQATELDPRQANAYNNAAAIAYLTGDYDTALGYLESAEKHGVEDNLNLKLKHLVYEALGRSTEGILEEDLSKGAESDLGVRRFALAFKSKGILPPPLYENCYIVFSRGSKQAVIIDPGVEDRRLDDFIRTAGLEVRAVLNTHGHEDHTAADGHFSGPGRTPVGIHRKDAAGISRASVRHLEDGDLLACDGFTVRVLETPGHTPGSVCFLIGGYLFSGDTLFRNDIGKAWPESGGRAAKPMETLVGIIKKKIMVLPGQTKICPGHGRTSTIADEKANNPFLKSG